MIPAITPTFRRRHLLVLLGAVLLGIARPVTAQTASRIRIAVDVEDDSIGGVVSSAIRSALRSLGDVDVVMANERPDVVLEGPVLCSPVCNQDWASVHVAMRLWQPVTRDIVASDLAAAHIRAADSSIKTLTSLLSIATLTRAQWVLTWGRNRYELAAKDFVATIDSQCFEVIRTVRRINSGSSQPSAIEGLLGRRTIC